MESEFTINITAENLRDFLNAMKEGGEFSEFFDSSFTSSGFRIKQEKPGDPIRYQTRYIIKPQSDSVRIVIRNEYPEGADYSGPYLAWDKIRSDLERSGYALRNVTGFGVTVVFEHSYIDPGTIKNPNHRKIIRALIEAELSPERVNQSVIADRFGYSKSRISEIKNLYVRPEFQNSE